jgi:hypothetical protein
MSRIKKNELRVFKLRSGEEIIAKVAGKTKDKIKLMRPMRVMNNIQTDPYTGVKRHSIFFSDWLGSTSEIIADIPLDFVVVDLPPDPDMVTLYDRQTEALDRPPAPLAPPTEITEEEMKALSNEVDKKLEDMLKQLAADGATGDSPVQGMKAPAFPSMFPPRPEGVIFSVSIPNDILTAWIESGFMDYLKDSVEDFISTDFLEEMMNEDADDVPEKPKKAKKKNKREKISKEEWNEPADDLKKKPNYGNSHEDWSPYLKDYLDTPEPPKNEGEG